MSGVDSSGESLTREIDKRSGVGGGRGYISQLSTQGEFRLSDDRYQYKKSWDIGIYIIGILYAKGEHG